MKIIRRVLSVIVVILILLYCFGNLWGNQAYRCESSAVRSIYIVSLDKYVEGEYRFEYTVLYEIEDIPSFVESLNNLSYSTNYGGPTDLAVGYRVIKIDYSNGNFDLIHPNAQWFNRSGVNQSGYFFFDEREFHNLIYKYAVIN